MDGDLAVIIEGEERALAEIQRLLDKLLRRARIRAGLSLLVQHADHDLHVVFLEAIEAERLAGIVKLSVSANLFVAVLGRPFGDVGVEAFPVPHHGREQEQVAALLQILLQTSRERVTRLGFDR